MTSRRKRKGFVVAIAIFLAFLLAAGVGLGFFYGFWSGDSATSLLEKGESAFESGDYEAAIDYYSEAVKKDPESSEGYNLLGMAYRFQFNKTGDADYVEREIAAFRKSIELDPRNYAPLVNLGATLYYRGETEEAAAYLQKALEINPDHPERAQIEEMIKGAQEQPGTSP
jgi:tetratricopeptide (TPR) repeat protein